MHADDPEADPVVRRLRVLAAVLGVASCVLLAVLAFATGPSQGTRDETLSASVFRVAPKLGIPVEFEQCARGRGAHTWLCAAGNSDDVVSYRVEMRAGTRCWRATRHPAHRGARPFSGCRRGA